MKPARFFRQPPRLQAIDLLLVAAPALAWTAAVHARPDLIDRYCAMAAENCLKEHVRAWDRISIGMESTRANALSFVTQDSAGYIALLLPLLWVLYRGVKNRLSPRTTAGLAFTDFVILLQATIWNGLLNELTRLIVQRPRPFVYLDPLRFGAEAANYTSFYSGHTSFTATAALTALLTLTGREAPRPVLMLSGLLGFSLVVATAYLRVTSGRHFPSDTIVGALAGFAAAAGIAAFHRGWRVAPNGT
jgi:membrane-associated phospholipid phosphatase